MASEVLIDPFDLLSGSPSEAPKSGKKSWAELRKAVRETRKLLTALTSSVPTSFVFRKIPTKLGHITRLYFLGVPPRSRENTFLYVDVPNSISDSVPQLPWMHLLDSFEAMPSSGQLSKQEQLLRERKRVGIFGINSFDFVESEGKFVFPACNSLFVCTDSNVSSEEPILPDMIKTVCLEARLDPKLCPTNSDLAAFVHNSDIWVTHLKSGQEKRLTFVHKGVNSLVADPLSAGMPSFVVQEEFDRYTGYWWQPSLYDSDGAHQILYEEVDESGVEILHTFAPTSDLKGVDEYRYPRAGTCNAKSTLKLVEFFVSEEGQIFDRVVEKQLNVSLSLLFPWMEYVVRAGWTPDSKYVHAQLLSRSQQRLVLILIPVDCFVAVADNEAGCSMDCSMLSQIQVIYEDRSDIWVNVHDILYFFPQELATEITFLWSSEKTGFRHLYLVTAGLKNPHAVSQESDVNMEDYEDSYRLNVICEVALTRGDWEVSSKDIWVDERKAFVYFIGLRDTVLETQLYAVSYILPEEPVRLTQLGFSHSVFFNSDCSLFVTVYSSVKDMPECCVRLITYVDGVLQSEPLGMLMTAMRTSEYKPPELFSFKNQESHTLYGMCYKPHNLEPNMKYPTVLFVYGGPQVQLVTNSFKGLKFLRLHTLASQGYAVVVIDGRGSSNRGLKFEGHIKKCLGSVEIGDQVEGLQWLASQVDFIDLSRVAIHGWSYGGYLSLMGLVQKPEMFKVAIAGAPVVSWKLYDTGYTERYMDVPDANPEGYTHGSVLAYVDIFPDEENRLLIIHGLIDENVHFHHTNSLISALIRSCKPYTLQVYPNERHGIRNHDASEHYKTMVLSFLQENL